MTVPLISERGYLAAATPQVLNIELPEANTEYQFQIPNGVRQFMFKSRNPADILQFSFEAGASSSTFITLERMGYYETNILANSLYVYIQSRSSNSIIECLVWY